MIPPSETPVRITLTPLHKAISVAIVCSLGGGLVGYAVGYGAGESSVRELQNTNSSTLGGTPLTQAASGGPPPQPVWTVSEDKSPVNDTPTVTLEMETSKPSLSRTGMSRPTPLVIRCKEGETDFFVAADEYLGSDPVRVTYRLDNQAAKTDTWSVSTEGEAAFAPDAVALAKQAISVKHFFIRISDFQGTDHDFEYAVGGLSEVLPRVAKACHWH